MGALRAISTTGADELELAPAAKDDALAPVDCPLPEPDEEEIRLRSKQIWEREGCPEGYAEDHWARARAELAEQMARIANRLQYEVAEPLAEPEPIVAAESPATAMAVTPSPTKFPMRASSHGPVVPSIICAGMVLHGVLESPGDLQFDGCMDGEIRSPVLHVGEAAIIQGDVTADELTVRGRIRGTVRARKVLLCRGAHVEGDIWYGALTVENGAGGDATFHRLEDWAQEAVA